MSSIYEDETNWSIRKDELVITRRASDFYRWNALHGLEYGVEFLWEDVNQKHIGQ